MFTHRLPNTSDATMMVVWWLMGATFAAIRTCEDGHVVTTLYYNNCSASTKSTGLGSPDRQSVRADRPISSVDSFACR